MNLESKKKAIFFILGLVLFFVIGYILPIPEQLEAAAEAAGSTGYTAMRTLAALSWAICWWAGTVIPDWCTALGLQCVWILAAGLNFSTVFSGFSNNTLWLIIGTFTLAAAITKTGLLHRISLYLMRLFPSTYKGQIISLMMIGTICSPLMPSTTAKAVLGSKLACSSADIMCYKNNSRGRSGMFVAAWTGFGLMGPVFLSASFLAYSLLGAMPAEFSHISWLEWFMSMLPWGGILLVGMYLVICLLYRPENQDVAAGKPNKEQRQLGKMQHAEKITAGIVAVCLVFWILEKVTGISAGVVALIGGILCFALGVLDGKEIVISIPWNFILLVGVVLNMGEIFAANGISDWLLAIISPLFSEVSNIYLVVVLVFVSCVFMRLIIASQTAVIILLTCVFAPIAQARNIHPLFTGFVVYAAISCWAARYQNPTYLAALEGMGGTIRHMDTVKAAIAYLAVSLTACLCSVPYWGMLGYF